MRTDILEQTFLYLTRDVAELLERKKKYDFDEAIYVVSLEQDQHIAQLFALASRYGGEFGKRIAKTCKHINFGLVLGMRYVVPPPTSYEYLLTDSTAHERAQSVSSTRSSTRRVTGCWSK